MIAEGNNINTGGGSSVGESVDTGGGDFVGRDQNISQHYYCSPSSFSPRAYHNLPRPDYEFVGRREELARLQELLSPRNRAWVVSIDGVGGVGKSALALEAAYYYLHEYGFLPKDERFEAIVWTSAKSSILAPDGIKTQQQITQTLDDIYTAISVTLEQEDIVQAPSEKQRELVRRALTQKRTLLIVDNLEALDDEYIEGFLRELPEPSKAIVTTRHRAGVAYPMRLMGMSEDDGLTLIGQECAQKGIKPLTEAEAKELYAHTGGVPLAITWSVAQIACGHKVKTVLRLLGDTKGDIARFCFKRAMEDIQTADESGLADAYKLAMAFPLFAEDADRKALGCAADLSHYRRDKGLTKLENLSLITHKGDRFSVLPLTRSYLRHELTRHPAFERTAFEHILEYYQEFVSTLLKRRVGVLYWDGLANYDQAENLEPEAGNLLHIIRRTLRSGNSQYEATALDIFLPIVHFLHIRGFWDERLQLSLELCPIARKLENPAEVWLWVDAIAFLYSVRHQFTECIDALNAGRSLAKRYGECKELEHVAILADIHEASLHIRTRRDLELAQNEFERILQQLDPQNLLERGTPMQRIIATRAVTTVAFLSGQQEDFERQKEWRELELKLRQSNGENTTLTLCRLVDVSLKIDELEAAQDYLAETLVSTGKRDLPEIRYQQAKVAKKKNDLEKAREFCMMALQGFTQLEHRSGIRKTEEFLATLQSLPQKPKPSRSGRTVVFVTFESEFVKTGGLGAVMTVLPRQMAQHENCFVIAPYFKDITDLDGLVRLGKIQPPSPPFFFPLVIGENSYTVEVTEIVGLDDLKTYLLSCEGFFTAQADPYINLRDPTHPMDPEENPIIHEKLIEDALFFCAAVPKVLVELGETKDVILQLQDWETACAAQAVKIDSAIQSAACTLTLHNPYDRYLDSTRSSLIASLVSHLQLCDENVLVQMIPVIDSPISTVSQNFANDLTSDPLQVCVFADHLQPLLWGKGLVGIDNGPFGQIDYPFSSQAAHEAAEGDFHRIQQEKWEQRRKLAEMIEAYQRELAQGSGLEEEAWGADLDLSDSSIPVFLIMGRDDPRQKGFEVAAEVIRGIPRGEARYIFAPMPGAEGLLGLAFLKKLAQERSGEIKVFPSRVTPEIFRAFQRGSSFIVMPSYYEPFGAASEAYLAGTPVVARATGGLVQQIVPYSLTSLSQHGQRLVAAYHGKDAPPTGFLFREPFVPDIITGWRRIIDCTYWSRDPKGDRIDDDRKEIPLFNAIVQSATQALQDAIRIYSSDPIEYARLIHNGFKMLDRFSWDRAVQEYRQLYDQL